MKNKKVLVIGGDSRAHAMVWKLKQDNPELKIFCCPGNPGIAQLAELLPFGIKDLELILDWAKTNRPSLTMVSPEVPLVLGIADMFQKEGLVLFGPNKKAAQIEGSKIFFNELMERLNIPHPQGFAFYEGEQAEAKKKIRELEPINIVLKADGLCDGKGVVLFDEIEDCDKWIDETMSGKLFDNAGKRILIQERIQGQEISVMAITNGSSFTLLPIAKDNKRLMDPGFEGRNPNTGGMGGYAPVNDVSVVLLRNIKKNIIKPTLDGMRNSGNEFKGVLYAGLMLTKNGPMVLEYNCRFGNPETQVQLPLVENNLYEICKKAIKSKTDLSSLKIKPGFTAGVILAAAGYPNDANTKKGDVIYGLKNINDPDILIFHSGTKKTEDGLVTNGGRVLQVVAYSAESLDKAFEKAYSIIGPAGIHFEGMQYRKVLS